MAQTSTHMTDASPFRLSPPAPNRDLVVRPRLLEVLVGRFGRRLTVITGGAGFGKTSLLVQALEQNRLDPQGRDVWIGCTSGDGAAQALAAGVLTALGVEVEGDRDPVEAIVASVWALAPEEICLIFDDVHEVDDGSSAAELLDRLVKEIPANGHVVMAGRTPPPVRTARLRAGGDLVTVDEAALAFTDEEAMAFAELRRVDIGAVAGTGGWPALSELRVGAAGSAEGEFLWEEVLEDLPDDQHDLIVRLAPFEVVDDELLATLGAPDTTVAEIAAAVPLAAIVDGSLRLHDLWRPVLTSAPSRSDLPAGWHRDAVGLLQRRGRYREAFDVLLTLGDEQGAADLVAELGRLDTDTHPDDLLYVLKRLSVDLAQTGNAILLRGSMMLGVDVSSALDAFEEALGHFRGVGDVEGETIAQIRRASAMFILGDVDGMGAVVAEIGGLAEAGVERAARTITLMSAFLQLMGGDPRGAISVVEGHGIRADGELSVLAGYLVANASMELGNVQRALVEAESVLGRARGHLRVALQGLAIEARTILDPDSDDCESGLCWLIEQARVLDLPGSTAVATAGYATWLATKGRAEEARAQMIAAQAAATGVTGPHSELRAVLAEVILAIMEGDEATAAAVAERGLRAAPFGARPDRTYLVGWDAFYVLVPDTREVFDGLDVGPDFEHYRVAAQAVVALRERGDRGPAAALPWEHPDELHRSVLEPFLAELAVAASIEGNGLAAGLLARSAMDPHGLLRRVQDRYDGTMNDEAERLIRRIPARPVDTVAVGVLGPVELRRGGEPVEDPGWGRERVRSLLLYLVDAGRVRRNRAAGALWGDMTDEAASNNLRVTLNHLQQVLQPTRDRSSAPFFLQVDGDHLMLVDDERLIVDVRVFERHVAAAEAAESARLPSVALDHHLEAVALYRGPYLADAPDWDWGYYERIRLQSMFVTSATRAGELALARGEPREADRLAVLAAAEEPFAEPAHRLRARALHAAGDRAAARVALKDVIERLGQDGIEPEPETLTLLERL